MVVLSTITATAPPTATPPAPAMPAATETTDESERAKTSMLPRASITTSAPTSASVVMLTTRTSAPGATATPPAIEIAPAMPSCRNSLPAATRNACALGPVVGLLSLIVVPAPIDARVVAVTIVTAPATFTATDPAAPPEMPTVAMSSRFVAVTLTPTKFSVAPEVTDRMPVSSSWFGGGDWFGRWIE